MPNADIWPEMLRIADEHEKDFILAFLAAIKSYKKGINLNDLIKALEEKDSVRIGEILGEIKFKWFDKIGKDIVDKIANKIYETYNFSVIGLDINELELHKFIDEYVADLVVQIDKNTKEGIKNLIRTAWDEGDTPENLAKYIKESGIGLDKNRQATLRNYFHSLLKDEDLSKRFPNRNDYVNEINRLCKIRYDSLLLDRGRTIARTECINLANEGSRQMYEEAAKNNSILRNEYELCWILTPDDKLCDKCRAMRDKRSSFNGTFEGGLRRPTLHPRCRCCIVCVRKNSKALQRSL